MWGTREKTAEAAIDNDSFTFFGKGAHFMGVVTCDGGVRIDGRVEGEVRITGALIVGEQGIIKGMVSAGTVTVSGKITGTVTAAHNIQILTAGALIGDVHTPAITIQDGAYFHGMCHMDANKWGDEQPLPHSNIHDMTPYRVGIRSSAI
ncbi:MAG: polymer-forming cytoskeletal protein [Nitrospira sp.]|nr:polymer-forming cytoskeletal protein [Nitrospira sp.]MDH5625116.1 polymer-forming cytoskeletal protein [Nitrospira sp.]